MLFLSDFSNAARRLLTKTKLTEKLLNKQKHIVERIGKGIQVNKVPMYNYSDAIQITRRGYTTPNKNIVKSKLWQNPQDNTVYKGIQKTIEKKGREEPVEVATLLTKQNPRQKLAHTAFIGGSGSNVDIPIKPRDVVGSIHSHPFVKGNTSRDLVMPSHRDLEMLGWLDNKKKLRGNTEHSVVSLHPTGKTTVTKYSVGQKPPVKDLDYKIKTRKDYKQKYDVDYKVSKI